MVQWPSGDLHESKYKSDGNESTEFLSIPIRMHTLSIDSNSNKKTAKRHSKIRETSNNKKTSTVHSTMDKRENRAYKNTERQSVEGKKRDRFRAIENLFYD